MLFHSLQHPGMQRMQEIAIAENERNHGRGIARKNPGSRVGTIVQFPQYSLHPFPQPRVHIRLIIHHPGNGADRHAGTMGNIADGHCHGHSSRQATPAFMNLFMKEIYNTKAKNRHPRVANRRFQSRGGCDLSAYPWGFCAFVKDYA